MLEFMIAFVGLAVVTAIHIHIRDECDDESSD